MGKTDEQKGNTPTKEVKETTALVKVEKKDKKPAKKQPKTPSKTEQKEVGYRSLPEHEMLAVELKYKGYSYNQIWGTLKKAYEGTKVEIMSKRTLENIFQPTGRLYPYYQDYAMEMNDTRREAAINVMKANIEDASRTMVNLLQVENPFIKFRAAEYILDRELGKPTQPVEGKFAYYQIHKILRGETDDRNK